MKLRVGMLLIVLGMFVATAWGQVNYEREGIPASLPQVERYQTLILDFNHLASEHLQSLSRPSDEPLPGLSISQRELTFTPEDKGDFGLTLEFELESELYVRDYRWSVVEILSANRRFSWQETNNRSAFTVDAELLPGDKDTLSWWVYPVISYNSAGELIEAISLLVEFPAQMGPTERYSWRFSLSRDEEFSILAPELRAWEDEDNQLSQSPIWDRHTLASRSDRAFTLELNPNRDSEWAREVGPYHQFLIHPRVAYDEDAAECYIATSVYGDAYASEVIALREFRSQVLMQSRPGRWLVQKYYHHSPAWVEWMDDKPRLQAVVRWGLDQFVSFWQWLSR